LMRLANSAAVSWSKRPATAVVDTAAYKVIYILLIIKKIAEGR